MHSGARTVGGTVTFPVRTTTLRVERHERVEPYEPPVVTVVDHVDGALGRITQAADLDGGAGERVTMSTTATVAARTNVEPGMVMVDGDGNVWNVDAVSARSALGVSRKVCALSRVVGSATRPD
jgi:hypothetical protein